MLFSVIQLIAGGLLRKNKTADFGERGDGERVVKNEIGSLIVRISTQRNKTLIMNIYNTFITKELPRVEKDVKKSHFGN